MMNRRSMKILAMLVSLAMATGLFAPCTVFADTAKAKEKTDLVKFVRKVQEGTKEAFDFRTKESASGLKLLEEERPSEYDMRELGYVTPVKFQNPFGSCWGFAAIAAAESSILSSGLAEKDGYDENTLNLSEKHLINFHVRPIEDKEDSQYGEGMYFNEDVYNSLPADEKAEYHSMLEWEFDRGGMPFFATSLFSSGMGPDLEDRTVPEGIPEDIFEYHGLNGETDKYKINGTWQNYCYSATDDWSMPEELRYKQSYVLKQSYMLPSPAMYVDGDEVDIFGDPEEKYVYNAAATDAIKDQLLDGRAVEIGFCADASMPSQADEKDGQYISREWAHYTYEHEPANHAVTIVGWDDDYPAENFVKGHEPKDDEGNLLNGAWLVKNSWGSEERDFPDKGPGWGLENDEGKATGYFWLSYYDRSLCVPEALEFDKSNVDKEYYIDEYDFMPVEEVFADVKYEEVKMANVFKAEVAEQLEQISCQTASPGTEVSYQVFLLSPGFTGPEDGVEAASGSETFEYGGFHKITLDDPVPVMKGQSYAIVIREKAKDAEGNEVYNMNLQMSYSEELIKAMGDIMGIPTDSWVKGVVNPKESFVTVDGEWMDLPDYLKDMLEDYISMMTFDNFPIKGYCTEIKSLNVKASPAARTLTLAEGDDTANIRAIFSGGASSMPDDPDFTWEIKEGGEEFFSIEQNADNHDRCKVTAKKPGVGYIKLTAKDGDKVLGIQSVRIEVSKYGVWLGAELYLEYGEKHIFDIMNTNFDFVEDVSGFTFTSDDPSIAKVDSKGMVTATGIGRTSIRATDSIGLEAVGEVEVEKAQQPMRLKGKKLSFKASDLKKANKKVKIGKAVTIRKAKGKKTYAKKSGSKKITVNKKTGLITIKKGIKKGTYKVKIKVTAKGSKYYYKGSDTAVVTVKIN